MIPASYYEGLVVLLNFRVTASSYKLLGFEGRSCVVNVLAGAGFMTPIQEDYDKDSLPSIDPANHLFFPLSLHLAGRCPSRVYRGVDVQFDALEKETHDQSQLA